MRITIVPLAFFLSAVIFLASCNSALAYENDIGQSQINPASPLYFLKAVRESLEMHFAQTTNIKLIRSLEFATRRLREVKSLIPGNRQDLIEPTLDRYWVLVASLPVPKDLKTASFFAKEISNNLVIHIQTLEKVYPQISNPRAKMAVRNVLNRLTDRQDIPSDARAPVCDFFAKEATSSALNDVEKLVLTSRAQKCYASLKSL
ncbi:hypothetical protein HYS96_00460 [Candidatus Daviesbacteria bacterium]|nr:hypothetical protein [Candidatus Daviesbacteria bacterium]